MTLIDDRVRVCSGGGEKVRGGFAVGFGISVRFVSGFCLFRTGWVPVAFGDGTTTYCRILRFVSLVPGIIKTLS